jgi:hypothetical protein
MPFAYPDRSVLKASILARVAAGETVAAICGPDGMPTKETVQVWRRGDPLFAADLVAARRRGDWMRRFAFDEGVAAAFLARMAAGEPVRSLLGRPGMPSQRTYVYWRRTQGEFQAALWRLREGRYSRRSSNGHGRWRAWDEAVADRMLLAVMRGAGLRRLLASDGALPCLAVLARWRREEPDWDRALRTAMAVGRRAAAVARGRVRMETLREEIGDRIVAGDSLRSLGAEADMPSAATLYAWFRRWPDFAREVSRACDIREDWLNDRMIDICERNGPFGLAATKRQAAPLQQAVNRLAKRPGWKALRQARADQSATRSSRGTAHV